MYVRDRELLKEVGHRLIKNITITDDDAGLELELIDGERFKALTEGDCCSSSWIEHLTVPQGIEGAMLLDVYDGGEVACKGDEIVKEDEYESIAVYHTTIATTHGEIIIEYRNSSNGYYGGWLNEFKKVK